MTVKTNGCNIISVNRKTTTENLFTGCQKKVIKSFNKSIDSQKNNAYNKRRKQEEQKNVIRRNQNDKEMSRQVFND